MWITDGLSRREIYSGDAYFTNYEEEKTTNGILIVPIIRKLTFEITNHSTKTTSLYAHGYRRIGTNV